MGYRKLENDIPSGYKSASAMNDDDIYPVSIYDDKVIPNNKIGKYLCSDFFYYNDIYENNKLFGLPYQNWLEMPKWLIQLHRIFQQADLEYENYLVRKGYTTK